MVDNRYWSMASCRWENMPVQPDFVLHEDLDAAVRAAHEVVVVPQQRETEQTEPAAV